MLGLELHTQLYIYSIYNSSTASLQLSLNTPRLGFKSTLCSQLFSILNYNLSKKFLFSRKKILSEKVTGGVLENKKTGGLNSLYPYETAHTNMFSLLQLSHLLSSSNMLLILKCTQNIYIDIRIYSRPKSMHNREFTYIL